jgi:AcrR family transcriptional regulator
MVSSTGSRRNSREDVLQAAEAIVDRDGWRHLSMTSLAAELGVKVPSLYNHTPSLETLQGELQNRALAAIGRTLRDAAMGKTREAGMRALAAALRRFALEHPGRYDLAMREPVDRNGFVEASLGATAAYRAVLASYGVNDEDLVLQLTFFAALHGVLVLESTGLFQDTVDGAVVYEQVLTAMLDILEAAAPPAKAG